MKAETCTRSHPCVVRPDVGSVGRTTDANRSPGFARCFEPFEQIFVGPVPGTQWNKVKRKLQRHGLPYVWVKDATRLVAGVFDRGLLRPDREVQCRAAWGSAWSVADEVAPP